MGAVGKTLAAPFVQTFNSVETIAAAPGKATVGQFANVVSAGVIAPNLKTAGRYYTGVAGDVGIVAGAAELTGIGTTASASGTINAAAAPLASAPSASLSPLASGVPYDLAAPSLTPGYVDLASAGTDLGGTGAIETTGAVGANLTSAATIAPTGGGFLNELGVLGSNFGSGVAAVAKDIIAVPAAILGALSIFGGHPASAAPATILGSQSPGTNIVIPGSAQPAGTGTGGGGSTTNVAASPIDYSSVLLYGALIFGVVFLVKGFKK